MNLEKPLFLQVRGAMEKSTLLNMLKTMLGKRNTSVLDLKSWVTDFLVTVMLFNKLANIGDDISDEFVTDAAEFKKIVTGETIDESRKDSQI